MEWLENIVAQNNVPLLSALALGLLTAIAPCPLATNITATAYIAKTLNSRHKVILSGLLYTVGRMVSYTAVAAVIYFGASKFKVAKLLQGNGERYMGFLMVLMGLIMLDVIRLNFIKGSSLTDRLADRFKQHGIWGAFLLGALFALAFCPYSGALYFGMLLPLTLQHGMHLPLAFSLGTGLPVVLFAFVIAYSVSQMGHYFKIITKVEKIMRIVAGITFIVTGLYYINIYFKVI